MLAWNLQVSTLDLSQIVIGNDGQLGTTLLVLLSQMFLLAVTSVW